MEGISALPSNGLVRGPSDASAKRPQSEGVVNSEFMSLAEDLAILEKCLSILGERLSPVLGPSNESVASGQIMGRDINREIPKVSELVRLSRQRVQEASAYIRTLTSRLEL